MSVLRRLRNQENRKEPQFVITARELQIYTLKRCANFPKSYTFLLSQSIANIATRIHEHVKLGNSIYPTNQHEVQMRRDYFLRARAEVENLTSQIELADDVFGISQTSLCEWARLLSEEEKLLKGILETDRNRYKKLPE